MTSGCAASAEGPLAQRELKAYVLHENPNSADISPDDSFVVTELSRREPTNDPSTVKVSDLVQLWDFRNDKLVAENEDAVNSFNDQKKIYDDSKWSCDRYT